jgi:hypothetical protein
MDARWVAWGTPASLILFKPSLLPFAFFGVHRRRWWLGLGLLGLLSLPFAGLTVTWIQVILNTHGRVGPFYNAEEFPYVAIPLVAWLGSSRFTMSEGRARVRRTAKSLLGRLGPKPVDGPEGSAVPEQSER